MKLLICIPQKTTPLYTERKEWCESTWLSNCGVDYKFFTDEELGHVEVNQHDNANDPVRCWRTKLMAEYAYLHGYDFLFRVDSDTYVHIARLLACGFEAHDYHGWCLPGGTAHGGAGFFLSRRAMKIVAEAPVVRCHDGKFWGDIWAGQQLALQGIGCFRDTRFLDGSSGTHSLHDGNILAEELPEEHPYIALHPVGLRGNMLALHEKLKSLPAETIMPERQIWS